MILGTPAYMSPEQARGQPVDRRTEIWAFGCCLYECLTGRRAFMADTVTDTLAAVLDKDPDWTALERWRASHRPPAAPPMSRQGRAAASPAHRRRAAGAGRNRDRHESSRRRAHGGPFARCRCCWVRLSSSRSAPASSPGSGDGSDGCARGRPVARLTLKMEGADASDLQLPLQTGSSRHSPSHPMASGSSFARGANRRSQLYVRELSGFETRPLPGTEAATTPFFSPDGQWIGFWRAEDRILRKVSIAGGSPIEIGPTECPDVAICGDRTTRLCSTPVSRRRNCGRSRPAEAQPKPIAVRDRREGEWISLRAQIPRSNDLLVASTGPGGTWLDVLSRETGKRRRLLRGGSNNVACYTRTGHLVYADADALFAVPWTSSRAGWRAHSRAAWHRSLLLPLERRGV